MTASPAQRPVAPTPPSADPKKDSTLVEWLKSIGVAIVAWLIIRTFLVEAFRIPSGSMERTLLVGDFLFVNKAVYGPEIPVIGARLPAFREPARNDVVVFDSVEEEGLKVVKRLVGVPGDTLSMTEGMLYRNGVRLEEPYAVHSDLTRSESPEMRAKMRAWQSAHLAGRGAEGYDPDLLDWGPIVVPADSFFMMGDNREDSYDGRYWGFLPRENVRGTPVLIYYSYDPGTWRALPALTAIRWGRIFSTPR